MRSLSLTLSWVIVPCLQCLFSRLRKYLVFFSPSLYHWDLDLKICSFCRILYYCFQFAFLCFKLRSHFLYSSFITFKFRKTFFKSYNCLFYFLLFFHQFLFLRSSIFQWLLFQFILTFSHSKLGLTVSSSTYSALVWLIIKFIQLTYSM